MRSHRKTLLPVGGSCPSAGGRGGGGGRHTRGLRESTHTHVYNVTFIRYTCTHTYMVSLCLAHLQQLFVLVSTGEGLRASGRTHKNRFLFHLDLKYYYFNVFVLSIPGWQRCKVHTIWRLCVADGGHSFQGRFQRKLNIGNHWAEGGRLLCGDLHGKYINRGSQTRACMHKHTYTNTNKATEKNKYEHMHINKQDSTGKGTDDRDTEDMC